MKAICRTVSLGITLVLALLAVPSLTAGTERAEGKTE
jgi:hypothetical protein